MFEIKTALICKLIAKHLEMLIQWLFVREKKKLTWSICQYLLLTTDTWFCWRWNIYILISKPTHIHIPFCTNISAWFFVLLLKGASEEQFVFWGRIWTGQPLYKSSATEKTEHWSFPSGEIDFETSPFFDWCGESNIFSVSPRRIVTTMNSTEQKTLEIQSSSKMLPMATNLIPVPRVSPEWMVCRPIVQDWDTIQAFYYFFIWDLKDYDAFLSINSIWENFNLCAISREVSPSLFFIVGFARASRSRGMSVWFFISQA